MQIFRTLPAAYLLVVVAACGDDGPGAPSRGASITVSGTVQDSAAARPIGFVVVSVEGHPAGSDRLGRYSVEVPEGRITVRLALDGYEPFLRTVDLAGDATVDVPLRRLPPLMKDMAVNAGGTGITATIVDLQGAGTVRRDENSHVIIHGRTEAGEFYQNILDASRWTWEQLDGVTWRVTLVEPRGGYTYVGWGVMDDTRNATVFDCRGTSLACTELNGRT